MLKVTIHEVIIGVSILLGGIISPIVYLITSAGVLTYILRRISRLPIVVSFITSILVYALAGSLLIHLAYMFHMTVNFHILHAILCMTSVALLLGTRRAINVPSEQRIRWDQEGVFLATFAIPFLFFVVPFFNASSSRTIELMESAEDTSSQFQMYHYVLSEGAIVYKDTGTQKMIRASLASYPQGSHAAAATITSGFIDPSTMSTRAILASFFYSMAFMYSSIFVFALATIHLISKGKRENEYTSQTSTLLVLSATVLVGLGAVNLFINWITYGFYGQIFSYSTLLLTLLVALIMLQRQKEEHRKELDQQGSLELLFWVTVMALAFFGVYGSWYLLAPVALLPIAAVVTFRFHALLQNYKLLIATLFLPITVCAYLTYVYLFTGDSSGHILTPGGVVQIAWPFLVLVSLSVVGILMYSLKYKIWDQALLASMAVAASGFAGAVGVYQQLKINHLEYYFYKTTFTALLLILISCLAFIAYMLKNADAKAGKHLSANLLVYLSTGTLLLFGVIGARYTKDDLWYYYSTQYGVVQSQRTMSFDVLLEPSIYEKYSDLVFVGDCDMHRNFLGTIWAGSMFLQYGQTRNSLEWEVLQKEGGEIIADITEYAKNRTKPVAVYVSGDCSEQYAALQAKNVDFLRK